MHHQRAAQRRQTGRGARPPAGGGGVAAAPVAGAAAAAGGGGGGPGVLAEVEQTLNGWIFSTRFVSSLWFIFGLIGRFFHVFDPLVQDYKSNFPSYLCCPSITFFSTALYVAVCNARDATSLPQVMTMITCCGVLAGAIIEEQLEGRSVEITPENFSFVSLGCVLLSFNIHAMDYRRDGPLGKTLLCFLMVTVPSWILVNYNLIPLYGWTFAPFTVLFSTFNLGVAIVDHYVTDARSRVPLFTSVFPAPYIGCLVQCFGMIAFATFYTSWRLRTFSDSWFSFAWMVYAGAPISVFTLVCHLIHWTSEKIFGPGPHNGVYVLRAVMVAWAVAAAVHQVGVERITDSALWMIPLQALRRLQTALGF